MCLPECCTYFGAIPSWRELWIWLGTSNPNLYYVARTVWCAVEVLQQTRLWDALSRMVQRFQVWVQYESAQSSPPARGHVFLTVGNGKQDESEKTLAIHCRTPSGKCWIHPCCLLKVVRSPGYQRVEWKRSGRLWECLLPFSRWQSRICLGHDQTRICAGQEIVLETNFTLLSFQMRILFQAHCISFENVSWNTPEPSDTSSSGLSLGLN